MRGDVGVGADFAELVDDPVDADGDERSALAGVDEYGAESIIEHVEQFKCAFVFAGVIGAMAVEDADTAGTWGAWDCACGSAVELEGFFGVDVGLEVFEGGQAAGEMDDLEGFAIGFEELDFVEIEHEDEEVAIFGAREAVSRQERAEGELLIDVYLFAHGVGQVVMAHVISGVVGGDVDEDGECGIAVQPEVSILAKCAGGVEAIAGIRGAHAAVDELVLGFVEQVLITDEVLTDAAAQALHGHIEGYAVGVVGALGGALQEPVEFIYAWGKCNHHVRLSAGGR